MSEFDQAVIAQHANEVSVVPVKAMLAQRADLDKQINEALKTERKGALAQIKDLMETYGITTADVASGKVAKVATTAGTKVPPKYQDPVTGKQWSGRGKQPLFIREAEANGTLESCRIV